MGEKRPVEERLRSLMLASLDGDAAQYRTLLKELTEHLRRYVARRLPPGQAANAEDVVQDCLMAIHTRRMTYDRQRPFTAWAYAIARYKLIDHLRQRRVTEPIEEDDALFGVDEEDKISARLDVEGLLKSVPAATGALIREVQIEGASIAEAARRADISETAAKVRIHRGLKALATMIAGGRTT